MYISVCYVEGGGGLRWVMEHMYCHPDLDNCSYWTLSISRVEAVALEAEW